MSNKQIKAWSDGNPVYSWTDDRLFFDRNEAEEYLEEYGNVVTLHDLQLCRTYPLYARPISLDYWEDELPDDGPSVDDRRLKTLIDDFNTKIGKIILSYRITKTPVTID